MAAKEDGSNDETCFLRTEDFICLNCSVTTPQNVNRRMGLAAEAFGNKMCFLEDITLEETNVTPDFPACIFVLEQALSVRALQEVVNSSSSSTQQTGQRTLLYGHAVLLRHLQSNMYLTCLNSSTSNDKLAFDVGLKNDMQGESCWWTIHPASKQRSEGEKVRIGDDIILVSVATERYLHIYLVENAIHRVNASFQQTLWTLFPISSGTMRMKNTGYVYGGEVLRLFHGNMDQCFTLPQSGVSEFPYSIFFETGAVCSHARSLWRLEFLRTKWYGGFMGWNSLIRLRHITSGRYLGVVNGEVCVIHRDKADGEAITFMLLSTKDDKQNQIETEIEESMSVPTLKYGDSMIYIRHVKSNFWLSYTTYETKKRGVGKVEEKKAELSLEGHMDDCFTLVKAQEEEARSALVIRKCMSLFTKFIRTMDLSDDMTGRPYWKKISLDKVLLCLIDLIEFFAQPEESCSHEERQIKLKNLRNRQDLFHEEGMINLVLDTIDKYSETKNMAGKMSMPLFEGYKQQQIDEIYDKLYTLLATMIKGNRNNCAQFAQGNRLDSLINRLTSEQASAGVLEVLHCVLIDSPEALNMIKERHIQGIISLLDRNGKDPKVLEVLCSLCANNGIAVRTNQNLICENLLPRGDLLLQTRLIDQISCMRPNIMVGVEQGESVYKKWYFEVEIDYIENLGGVTPHCRIGWANTDFQPAPDGSDGFNSTGVGDDVNSFGFDGANLWFGGRSQSINTDEFYGFKKGDVIGCLLDLSIPEIWFSLNGVPMKGFFREFNLFGTFYPVISASAKISCRFLFGDENGRFKSGPPEGCAPIYQAMLSKQKIRIEPCFNFGDLTKNCFYGPPQPLEQIAFTPNPVDTTSIEVPEYIEGVRDKLAENLHEIWAMYKIEQGWKYSEFRNDMQKLHNCICQFEMLPSDEKHYDTTLAMETLKTMFALGFEVLIDTKQDQKRLKLLKLNNTFLQSNGYKPSPLDLNNVNLNAKLEELVELLAENTHNVWAKERIRTGWTYGVCENTIQKRHPYLLPYDKVDNVIKKANRETSLDTVKTLLAYGYIIEPPAQSDENGGQIKSLAKTECLPTKFTSRTYRAEKTYAIKQGKWYYEVEILTPGKILVGWCLSNTAPNYDMSTDSTSYSFDCSSARKCHLGSETFGKVCTVGDIIGVMIDLVDKKVSFALNGEILLDPLGTEFAFDRIFAEEYVPAFSLDCGQKIRCNFGQDVNSLHYFTSCGLQQGYEPFGVNMTKQITFWYANEVPIFANVDETHETIECSNVVQDSIPTIKLTSKTFGTHPTKMEYLRLCLPLTFHDEYVSKMMIKEKRLNALSVYKAQLREEEENQRLWQAPAKRDRSSNADNKKQGKIATNRSKSPFKFMNKLSREQSPVTGNNKNGKKDKNAVKAKVSRSSEFGMKFDPLVNQFHNMGQQAQLEAQYGTKLETKIEEPVFSDTDSNYPYFESDDMELQAIMDYVDEYYYGVRLFPGQDISKVYIGWTTSKFHLISEKLDKPFTTDLISQCTLINTTSDGSITSSLIRKDCYCLSAAELNQSIINNDPEASKNVANGILLGCIVDTSTGILSFCVNGKDVPQKFQVEPGTKLYPAVFIEPTTKEMLQFELGRVRNCLPLSAGMFPSLGKHVVPKCPARLKVQFLNPMRWSRVLNTHMKAHTLKMNNVLGWSLLCEENINLQAINIPEEDRWISILELNENQNLLEFYKNTLLLYEAVCAQSNNYVAHQVCKMIDERQIMYCINSPYLSGPLRKRYFELLIKLHLEAFVSARILTKNEFVIPLCNRLFDNKIEHHINLVQKGHFPARDELVSCRPSLIKEEDIKNEAHKQLLVPPKFNLEKLKHFVINAFTESVKLCITHIRDPIGGSNSYLFVPLIKLINQLVIIDIFSEQDLNLFMTLLEPHKFSAEMFHIEEGLLAMNLEDDIKYEICCLFHSLCDYLLRYRVEAITSFSSDIVGEIQVDQKKRYNELKESTLPNSVIAKKTKEFRMQARDQMIQLVAYKTSTLSDMADSIKETMQNFHNTLNTLSQIKERQPEEAPSNENENKSMIAKVFSTLFFDNTEKNAIAIEAPPTTEEVAVVEKEAAVVENAEAIEAAPAPATPETITNIFSQLLTDTVIKWAKKSFITDEKLVREMFGLVYRQYNALGEIAESIEKTYVIGELGIENVISLLRNLSTVRGLLCVQMAPSEEQIMMTCLNDIMDNKVFFQHPDLMRILSVHETVMQVMINWLNRRQQTQLAAEMMAEQAANAKDFQTQQSSSGAQAVVEEPKEENTELVVVCCKFLSYFSRTSRQNQASMFQHLSYILDNSSMLLARPSLRGSVPLDVAVSSLMDNNDLSLALRESHLEKISIYLSRCGLQTNSELFAKGYPDIGWDPVEGERFLDFLKFCVWVNGDSVEENANLIVRLLIRRPECLGPALRGEGGGGGLLKAIVDGIRMSLQIAATQNIQNPVVMSSMLDTEAELNIDFMNENKFDFSRIPSEEDEDYIDIGGAILTFYVSLVELLGRAAPSEETIKLGKPDSVRARSILRSLVSMEDLEGVLALRFVMPIPSQPELRLPGIQPSHKMSIVLFMERVYGIESQEKFFKILETAFLPDIRTAIILDSSSCGSDEFSLALNRYLAVSVLPLLTSYSYYFDADENKQSLMESVLYNVYRLSKCKSLTTNQLEAVSEFLINFTNQIKPQLMKGLLPKLVDDLPTLEEFTLVPLKVMTLWYDKNGRYYSSHSSGLQASEEEKKLTMTLFQKIFDALAKRPYNPELFSKALPCLSSIGGALSPDYSYTITVNNNQFSKKEGEVEPAIEEVDVNLKVRAPFVPESIDVLSITLPKEYEEISKTYSEHVHDYWCYKKFDEGWSYGEIYNDGSKIHPMLKPYNKLSRKDQMKYEDLTTETLKAIKALGWSMEKADGPGSKNTPRLPPKKLADGINTNGYTPKPFDLSNTTLTRDIEDLSVRLSINCHNIWAKRKTTDLESIGAELHHILIFWELLTDIEKASDLQFTNELMKFLQCSGVRLINMATISINDSRQVLRGNHEENSDLQVVEVKFANNLLEKLLEYVEKASINMQPLKESSCFSRKQSFKTSGQDVKFFTKVVLPLVERYFMSHRIYFILKSNSGRAATAKEKEMICSLFCKLALLMRKKLGSFGSDTNITVRCLQVLIKAVDVGSVMKNSPEIIRASLLPYFSYAAEDLNSMINDMKNNRLSNIKGTSQKTLSHLDYVNMVLLPVLSSLFEHMGGNKYGTDVLQGELQFASYKILCGLWVLATKGITIIDREWIVNELNRHRPVIGECLGSFAKTFPVAFLENQFNFNNKYSNMYGMPVENLAEHSLEGQDIMNKVSENLPNLEGVIDEIGKLCESSEIKHESAPHIIEVLLPTICSYLNYWWPHGPSAKQINENKTSKVKQLQNTSSVDAENLSDPSKTQLALPSSPTNTGDSKFDGAEVTAVTSDLTNKVLGYVLMLINNNIDEKNASWMTSLSSFSQSIIMNATPDMLEKNFLPVSVKIAQKAKDLYVKEQETLVAARSVESSEREEMMLELQGDWEVLIRNLYAFYPLLIKYVDLHKAYWLKNPDEHTENLYYTCSEVFNIWYRSKIFQKEETTFVATNEIDNMILLMPAGGSTDLTASSQQPPPAAVAAKKGKRRQPKEKKKFTSLIVASLKRIIQIGISFFGGSEQELIQMAKQKFIDIKTQEILTMNEAKGEPSIEVNSDQEELVLGAVKNYIKSLECLADPNAQEEEITDGIDKETYTKTKWMRMLYGKIVSKRHLIPALQSLSPDEIMTRMIEMAKVLYGLHMVEHPHVKEKGLVKKLVSTGRKRAIMACFRMVPVYSLATNKAINLFLKSYKVGWLKNPDENDTDINCIVPDLCPPIPKKEAPEEPAEDEEAAAVVEETSPDPLRQLITTFNISATTETSSTEPDNLFLQFSQSMTDSCVIVEEEEGGEEDEEVDPSKAFQEAEMIKQKLLFEQNRLADRGAAEMALLYISASKGEKTEMLENAINLGISLLHGGNVEVQQRMLKHLKEKRDAGFFNSLAGLMSSCTVLDLDTFERCVKAEQSGGLNPDEMSGKKNLHDAEFTISLFRFLQLLCEGHNLEFQNYLRIQPGNPTIVNTVICTVDYLLRMQESIMDFYWLYSSKSTVDDTGKENFCKAIAVASQVFNSLTEYIQGPCVGNQLTLANSRLWDAIGGFLYIFANLQDKLSKDPNSIDLLKELMNLQKDMIIMLLSMLEGNVLNGPIGKQMVDTLVENQQNLEMLLTFFDIFLKMKDLTNSEAFLEFDANGDGWISPKEFRKAMEAQKTYSPEEIDYVLLCVDANLDGKIDINEFSERFHEPSKEIGFNLAVLLTNLSEHMSRDTRLDNLMKKASSFLSYFEPFLGRIEITGSSGRIERVYFEIKESSIEQWNKPQIKDSKRQFLFNSVNEGDDKEKLQQFVDFCIDSIFEMQHASSISTPEEPSTPEGEQKVSLWQSVLEGTKTVAIAGITLLSPERISSHFTDLKSMTKGELVKFFFKLNIDLSFFLIRVSFNGFVFIVRCIVNMFLGTRDTQPMVEAPTIDTSNLAIDSQQTAASSTDTAVSQTSPETQKAAEETAAEEGTESAETKKAPKSGGFKAFSSMLARNFYTLKYIALILAFIINFFMLFYKAQVLESEGDGGDGGDVAEAIEGIEEEAEELIEIIMMDEEHNYILHILKVLSMIHTTVSFAMLIAYYVLKVPLLIFKREKEIAKKLEFEGMWIAEQPSEDDLRSHWDKLVIRTTSYPAVYWDKFVKKKVKSKYCEQFDLQQLCKLLGMNPDADEFKFDDTESKAEPEPTGLIASLTSFDWNYQIWKWGVIFTDNSWLYVFWYFVFSVIGNFNYFFFATHLLDIAISIKSLTTILKSITHNGKNLMLTIMLMSIIVYLYTVIAFNFFRKFYASEEDGEVEQNCHDLYTCFKFHLYKGIRAGGGIGDEIESPAGDYMEYYRMAFDVSFFFFIIVILLAIIQGLIIDAFGELRDQLDAVKENLEAACFICGMGKDFFDQVPHGFEIHTMQEHNFANYMFFFMHLINKPETEYTGQETYVWQLYQERCWDFFPAGDCFRKQHEGELEG